MKKNLFFISGHPATKLDVGYRLSRSGLVVAYGYKLEFLGPIVSNISYINGSAILNITYSNVSDFDLRSSNGFDVFTNFHYLIINLFYTLSFRFVVEEINVKIMEIGIHHLSSVKMV